MFSLYTQLVMEKLREMNCVRLGRRNINNIKYADDMVLIAHSEEKLHNFTDRLQEQYTRIGLKKNIGKT